jgi:hypothetical protein
MMTSQRSSMPYCGPLDGFWKVSNSLWRDKDSGCRGRHGDSDSGSPLQKVEASVWVQNIAICCNMMTPSWLDMPAYRREAMRPQSSTRTGAASAAGRLHCPARPGGRHRNRGRHFSEGDRHGRGRRSLKLQVQGLLASAVWKTSVQRVGI